MAFYVLLHGHVQGPKEGRGRTSRSREREIWEDRLLPSAIREEEATPQVREDRDLCVDVKRTISVVHAVHNDFGPLFPIHQMAILITVHGALFLFLFVCAIHHGSEMVALWAMADVALVTSLREGLNLGAMEFVACQQTSMHGVLVYRSASQK